MSNIVQPVISELLDLQDRFNQRVREDWMEAGFEWHRAIWMECAELIEGTNSWKWWKGHSEPSLPQLQLEVIDLCHFTLSWSLVEGYDRCVPSYAEKVWAIALEALPSQGSVAPVSEIILRAEKVAMYATGRKFSHTLSAFVELAKAAGLTLADLRKMYVAKNALNTVRNLNGYKDGSYIKLWDGEEDNAHLERLMEAHPGMGFDAIINTLNEMYAEIARPEACEPPRLA